MASVAHMVADAAIVVIFCVVVASGLCAIKIALCTPVDTRPKFNKYITPRLPCDGTLVLVARDGVMYIVPEGKAVVKTDMVREVHGGRIARVCDHDGNYTYFENNVNVNDAPHGHQHGENAVDHLHAHWSIGSVRSQEMTVSASDDESLVASPPRSPLAGESLTMTNELQMI
ncbi:unnamed protein product [Ectocarpus sp. 6 AP-2014]